MGPRSFLVFRFLVILGVVAWMSACSTPVPQKERAVSSEQPFSRQQSNEVSNESSRGGGGSEALEGVLREEAAKWKGVPHKWGGQSRSGIDCSGWVIYLYQRYWGVTLPRRSQDMVKLGEAVSREALQAGDLVFFKTGVTLRHVGVFLGNNEFVHVSSRRGVTVSRIDDVYWGPRWWTARRLQQRN
jgi:cell wall-associated NlpC family hydrolase